MKTHSKIAVFCFDMYEYFCGEQFNAISLYKYLKSKGRDVSLYNIVTSKNKDLQNQNKATFGVKYNVVPTSEIDLSDDASFKLEDLDFDKAVFCGIGIAIDLEKVKNILYEFSKPFFLFARIGYGDIKYPQKTSAFQAADLNPHLVAAFDATIDKDNIHRWNTETSFPDFTKNHKEIITGLVAHLLDLNLKSVVKNIKPHSVKLEIVAASRMCKAKNVYELANIADDIEKNVRGLKVKFYGAIPPGEKADLDKCKPFAERYCGIFGNTSDDPRASAMLSFCGCGYVQDVESLDERDVKLVIGRRFEITAFEALELGSIPIFPDTLVPKSCKNYPFQLPMLNNRPDTIEARKKRLIEIVKTVQKMSDNKRARFCRKWYKKAYRTMLSRSGIHRMTQLLK